MEVAGDYRFLRFPLSGIDFFPEECVRTSEEMRHPHYHDMYEIYYLISGERNYLIGNRTYNVLPGDLLFIRPYEIHRATNTSTLYHERFVIHFGKQFLAQDCAWLEDPCSPFATHTPVIKLPVGLQKRVEELLHRIVVEYRERDRGFEANIKAALLELLILSIRQNRKTMNGPAESSTQAQGKISNVIRFINENYEQPLTLELLAEKFHISPYYLSRLFKNKTGCTYVEYMTTVRVKSAQRMLRETGWKVTAIAEKVGFQDISHFGKIFKKITNCTPLQYRKMYRKSPENSKRNGRIWE
jgi:AraC-like DNA-binding protein